MPHAASRPSRGFHWSASPESAISTGWVPLAARIRETSMSVKSVVVGGIVAVALATPALALDAIEARQALLKAIGDDVRPVAAMLKGEAPFDLAKVKAALKTTAEGADKLPAFFPDNSRTGKTEASPRIWAEKERFLALYGKLAADARAADAAITDEASLKATFPKLLGQCKACHDDYRVKK
jgi:cytochrome c556